MVLALVLLIFVLLLALAYYYIKDSLWLFSSSPKGQSIFDETLITNPPEESDIELDQAKRDAVLKNSFSPDKVPDNLDAIVIGSGLGGLSVASFLSRAGKKVLVLEQHDQAGGCCHVFIDKGFEFDIGIHYVGKMNPGNTNRILSDQLTNGKLQWLSLDETYDTIALGEEYSKRYYVKSGREKQVEYFIEQFPKEEKAIRSFYKKMEDAAKVSSIVGLLKFIPKFLAKFLLSSGILLWLVPNLKYLKMTVEEVLNEITDNKDLRAVLTYSFGNYGTPPGKAPFYMHSLLLLHFLDGSYYPKGGSSEIAFNIIPTIEASGGRVLVRVRVKEILVKGGAAVGVRVSRGKQVYELYAPIIISDAGLTNTVTKLLPAEIASQTGLSKLVKKVSPGPGFLMIFIGLGGTKEELGLAAQNTWAFTDPDVIKVVEKYFALSAEEARDSSVPLMFVSFPSSKDPTFNDRYPGKSTCAIVTVTPFEWFEEWKGEQVQKRGEDYVSFKTRLGRRLWEQVCKLHPQLEDKLEYLEVGTPLSNQFYLESYKGEVYGLDHDIDRFDPSIQTDLRPQLPVDGLYLTGQDVFSDGFSGAMFAGLITASAVLKKNLMGDLQRLRSKWKKLHQVNGGGVEKKTN